MFAPVRLSSQPPPHAYRVRAPLPMFLLRRDCKHPSVVHVRSHVCLLEATHLISITASGASSAPSTSASPSSTPASSAPSSTSASSPTGPASSSLSSVASSAASSLSSQVSSLASSLSSQASSIVQSQTSSTNPATNSNTSNSAIPVGFNFDGMIGLGVALVGVLAGAGLVL